MDIPHRDMPAPDRSLRPRRTVAGALAGAALAAGLLTGCTADTTAAPTPSASATTISSVALPDSALGGHAQWVLDAINGDVTDVAADAAGRLAPTMLEQVPPDQLAAILSDLEPHGPWTVTAVEDAGTQALITMTPDSGDALDMQIVVDADELIAGLLFAPSAGDREPSTSWSELEDTVAGFAADTTMTVTEVTGGEASRLAAAGDGSAPGERVAKPSGSMFKLYVLGAVTEAVDAGDLSWNQALIVTDDVKSLPSGELQDAPSGSTVTVQEAAEKMIAISDNTATDLLMATVGPEAVERAFADLGHHDPELNSPVLTTRALFQLGWGAGGSGKDARARWVAAGDDAAAKRAVIDALPSGLLDVPAAAITSPAWQDGLDWFTTADDLVAAHRGLQELAATDAGAPLRGILSANAGLPGFSDEWDYVAYKGGSSIGVLAGSWYLERTDGRSFVITIQGATDDPRALADQATFFGQVEDAVALLEQE